ncbi:MAG TPA: DUF5615 family PIN-like protein, partial [Planctomycetota bacterium]|nr:DUF5615 family PIN-like protein [Planctomycetota bacterium]
ASWLASAGHDVFDANTWDKDPGDAAILQRALAEDRILITIDRDFGLLVFAEERPHRGLVRLPDCPSGERIAILADLLDRHRAKMEERAVITVRGGRVRISQSKPPA